VKEALRQKALDLGFDACRFASADPPDHSAEFQNWLEQGRHGEMGWIQRNAHKRLDPGQVLPGVRSVIVLAARYPHDALDERTVPDSRETSGVIARYARGRDYHEVLREPLQALASWIGTQGGPGCRSLWYADTGPVLERDFAQRAGLGFAGKHTNLISRKLGNWFLLAEILTTAELPPDPPERNHCGSCVKCITACPTQAIIEPFVLDARRCVSYLTIELRGPIPEDLRAGVGDRVFGCDDCLAVCPWNRFAREGALMRKQEAKLPARLPLRELLQLDEPAFKSRFGGTPILRAKLRGLRRNVCVALGNAGTHEDLPALDQARNCGDPLVAEHAQWATQQIERRPKPQA